jgi:sRNA-binding regulator protein Hfq
MSADPTIGLHLEGVVTQFDEFVALGEITDSSGTVWPFHCVSIADGTRTIAVGAIVQFETAWRVARVEAVDIRPA